MPQYECGENLKWGLLCTKMSERMVHGSRVRSSLLAMSNGTRVKLSRIFGTPVPAAGSPNEGEDIAPELMHERAQKLLPHSPSSKNISNPLLEISKTCHQEKSSASEDDISNLFLSRKLYKACRFSPITHFPSCTFQGRTRVRVGTDGRQKNGQFVLSMTFPALANAS